MHALNSFLASGNFWHLLIAFANSLNPEKGRQNLGPDLDPNHLTFWYKVFMKELFKKVDLKKKTSADDKKSLQDYPACKA